MQTPVLVDSTHMTPFFSKQQLYLYVLVLISHVLVFSILKMLKTAHLFLYFPPIVLHLLYIFSAQLYNSLKKLGINPE